MQLRFSIVVAEAQALNCSSDLTPNLGISTCHGYGPKKKKKKKMDCRNSEGVCHPEQISMEMEILTQKNKGSAQETYSLDRTKM